MPLQSLVQSLTKSYEIVKAQRKQAKAQLAVLQAKLDKQQQAQQQQQQAELESQRHDQDLEDLQVKLVDLNNMVLDIDISMKNVTEDIASCQRPDEKEIHSTRLVRVVGVVLWAGDLMTSGSTSDDNLNLNHLAVHQSAR